VTNPGSDGAGGFLVSKFSKNRVIGRRACWIARLRNSSPGKLNVSVGKRDRVVRGGNGDTMVPLVTLEQRAGIRNRMMDQATINRIVDAGNGGAEIVKLPQDGQAYCSFGAAGEMAESNSEGKKKC